MKKVRLFLLMALLAIPAMAQEQVTRDVRLCEPNDIREGLPIDVTKESSEGKFKYSLYAILAPGDYLTRLVFNGYNPGNEFKRHVTLQISLDISGRSGYTTVFDGECTIPSGGTADACIPMLTIDFPTPFLIADYGSLWVKVASTGEPVETPVYFEQYSASKYSCLPVAILTILSDTFDYECTITDQDGTPVKGAEMTVHSYALGKDFTGTAGEDGKCSVKLDDINLAYQMTVTAPGFPDYESIGFYVKEVQERGINGYAPKEVMLYGQLDFVADRQATIVLPQAPDPSWGRYYRLDRHEGRDIIFERELEPKAGIPYVIFPNEDFSINLADYDLTQLEDPEVVPFPDNPEYSKRGFIGSYKSQPTTLALYDGEYMRLLDSTPDCKSSPHHEERIGACRAYLVVGAYTPRYVFVGEETVGIVEHEDSSRLTPHAADNIFDLQGRRLKEVPAKGLYVRGGQVTAK